MNTATLRATYRSLRNDAQERNLTEAIDEAEAVLVRDFDASEEFVREGYVSARKILSEALEANARKGAPKMENTKTRRTLKFVKKVTVRGMTMGLYAYRPNQHTTWVIVEPKTKKKIARGRTKEDLMFSLKNSLNRARTRAAKRLDLPGAPEPIQQFLAA